MSVLTEAEIRTAIEDRWTKYPRDNGESALTDAVVHLFDLIDYRPAELDDPEMGELGNEIWTNLRPSEAERLRVLADDGRERAIARAREVIIEEVVATALLFDRECPDAPRQKQPVLA